MGGLTVGPRCPALLEAQIDSAIAYAAAWRAAHTPERSYLEEAIGSDGGGADLRRPCEPGDSTGRLWGNVGFLVARRATQEAQERAKRYAQAGGARGGSKGPRGGPREARSARWGQRGRKP